MTNNLNRAEFSYQDFKNQVLSKIISGKLSVAIGTIRLNLDFIQDREVRNMLSIICHDYCELRKEIISGILPNEDKKTLQRQIIDRILKLFDDYEEI